MKGASGLPCGVIVHNIEIAKKIIGEFTMLNLLYSMDLVTCLTPMQLPPMEGVGAFKPPRYFILVNPPMKCIYL